MLSSAQERKKAWLVTCNCSSAHHLLDRFPVCSYAIQLSTAVMASYDVVVVGAGIEGSATAYYLLKKGLNVLLLEQVSI